MSASASSSSAAATTTSDTTTPPREIRKRPVSFGNPALGTYNGFVYTVAPTPKHPSSLPAVVEGAAAVRRWVAMVHVPPHQVPEGILSVTAPHRGWMEHVRIVMEEQEDDDDSENNKTTTTHHERDRTYLVLIALSTEEAATMIVEDLHGQPYTSLDESVCCSMHTVVALQGVAGVCLISPFFAPQEQEPDDENNKFHEYNCAVCLEPVGYNSKDGQQQQQHAAIFTTICNHSFHLQCLLQWQDSPCPVCRYDHAGLNNETLSQCHVCEERGSWLCLLCGLVACNDHAKQHYDTTLHAYALNTETQHVWDFAGQGYVHRLLQNKEDGKLVEVNDPSSVSRERSSRPGLSPAQEGEVVHRKLEGFASQYYTLLKSQLEQQRIYYEGRLEEIRREHSESTQPQRTFASVLSALKLERQQLTTRLAHLQSRRDRLQDDVSFITNLNESLEANKEPLHRQMDQAQRDREEQRKMMEACLPELQEKVTRLMLQLENAMMHGDDDQKPRAR